jgi:Flp pilus assembly pilin Flp
MKHNFSNQRGQANVEVALLLVMVAIVSVLILSVVGVRLDSLFCTIVSGVSGGKGQTCGLALTQGTLFSDDFSKNSNAWNWWMGNWELCDGRLCTKDSNEHRAIAKGTDGKDYTISVDAVLESGKGYGIFFHASGSNDKLNGYTFQYDPGYGGGQFIMRKWVNGYEMSPPIAAASAPVNYKWNDVQRNVQVVAQGDTYTAKIDGQTILVGKDSTYTSGQAGLRVWYPSEANFDNFKVTTP